MAPTSDFSVLANDIVPVWRKQIARAKSSVLLVSPYLDSLVIQLLAKSDLNHQAITVLTDLRPGDNPQFYKKQLETLKHLSEVGYALRYTSRIHAKVLVVDGQWFSLGSQNFTKFARSSKEVSAHSTAFDDQVVLQTIDHWVLGSKEITYELILKLLDEVIDELKALEMADKKLNSKVDEIISTFVPPKAEKFREWRDGLGAIIRRQIDEMADLGQTEIKFARMRVMESKTAYGYETYESLQRTDSWTDLTRWRRSSQTGSADSQTLQLQPFNMYPMLFSDTGVMGFARIVKSRITYIRSSVKFDRTFNVGGFDFDIVVLFPHEAHQIANLAILLSNSLFDDIDILLQVIFDGKETKLVEDNIDEEVAKLSEGIEDYPEDFIPLRTAMLDLKSDPGFLFELVTSCCAPFVFDELQRGNKNVNQYALGMDYRLGITSIGSSVCLLAECVDYVDNTVLESIFDEEDYIF